MTKNMMDNERSGGKQHYAATGEYHARIVSVALQWTFAGRWCLAVAFEVVDVGPALGGTFWYYIKFSERNVERAERDLLKLGMNPLDLSFMPTRDFSDDIWVIRIASEGNRITTETKVQYFLHQWDTMYCDDEYLEAIEMMDLPHSDSGRPERSCA
jgi:hypothetical protein